jgi:hypothetical protein
MFRRRCIGTRTAAPSCSFSSFLDLRRQDCSAIQISFHKDNLSSDDGVPIQRLNVRDDKRVRHLHSISVAYMD